MRHYQLEHAIRAAKGITGENEFIIIGSSALLASFPDAPPELTASLEVDIYPRQNPTAGEKLNAIAELSPFHETHGFWVDPVGPETAVLPAGWDARLVPLRNVNTDQATGWCLDVHDLAVSKLFAGREKDLEFIGALLRNGFVRKTMLRERAESVSTDPKQKELALHRLAGL